MARALYEYYCDHSSLEGYEWVPADEQIEATLFGYGDDERVVRYLCRHDRIREIVDDLLDGSLDDTTAEARFRDLLSADDREVFDRTIDALAARENLEPYEDRLARQLLLPLFTNETERARHTIPLAARIGAEFVCEALTHELDPDSTPDPELRALVVRTLGDIGHPDARDALASAAEDDPDGGVRQTARAALDRIGS